MGDDDFARRAPALALPALLTADEVAEILRVSRRRVYSIRDQGLLPTYRVGRSLRFSAADVAAMLENGRVEPFPW